MVFYVKIHCSVKWLCIFDGHKKVSLYSLTVLLLNQFNRSSDFQCTHRLWRHIQFHLLLDCSYVNTNKHRFQHEIVAITYISYNVYQVKLMKFIGVSTSVQCSFSMVFSHLFFGCLYPLLGRHWYIDHIIVVVQLNGIKQWKICCRMFVVEHIACAGLLKQNKLLLNEWMYEWMSEWVNVLRLKWVVNVLFIYSVVYAWGWLNSRPVRIVYKHRNSHKLLQLEYILTHTTHIHRVRDGGFSS